MKTETRLMQCSWLAREIVVRPAAWRIMNGVVMRLPGLFVVLFAPAFAQAHTTEVLGGRLVPRPDGAVELHLEVSAQRLPVFVNALPESFLTWGDLRAQAGMLTSCFQRSLAAFVDGRHVEPGEVVLAGLESSADSAPLPEFITVLAIWRDLPSVPTTVAARFDLAEAYVMLVLDENLGGPAAIAPGQGTRSTAAQRNSL